MAIVTVPKVGDVRVNKWTVIAFIAATAFNIGGRELARRHAISWNSYGDLNQLCLVVMGQTGRAFRKDQTREGDSASEDVGG